MKINKNLFFFLVLPLSLCLAFILVYSSLRTGTVTAANNAFLPVLQNESEFGQFGGAPLDKAYPNIISVKVVYDLQRKQIYFINSHLYRLHYEFCSQVLGYKLGLNLFNLANYGKNRDYYLANINFIRNSNQYVLEFSSSDEIDSTQIITMYKLVSKHTFIKDKLKLLLNNSNTLQYFSQQSAIPVCDLNTLNEGLTYQMIQQGSCVGRLILCKDLKAQFFSITPADIIVVKGSPVEVPLCKAIISDCFQTPLSHIQVLSHNKKMPSAFLANIFKNENVLKYDGKIVKLDIHSDSLSLSPSSHSASTNVVTRTVHLRLNTNLRSMINIDKCNSLTNADIGAKAKGMADLKIISDKQRNLFQIPEGAFVIPFYFFKEHLLNSKIQELMLTIQQCDLNETIKMSGLLARIRNAINETPLSPALLEQVRDQIIQNKAGNSYRFRSSSNAEDLLNFSGAGLYDSKTGELNNSKKSIERAIKKVWASMYNYRAYQERRFANINEESAAMSILAHRNFPGEEINGVIITKNIYRNDYPGFIVNAQKGDISTVSPPDSVVCEQLILTENRLMNPFSKKISAKYICYSSLNPKGPLLNYEQLVLLQKSSKAVIDHFEEKGLDWDMEFKFEKGLLYIKQVRPYR